jgi:hypothetical protein
LGHGDAWLLDFVTEAEDEDFGRKQGVAVSLADAAPAGPNPAATPATISVRMVHQHWTNDVMFTASGTPYAGCFEKTDDTRDGGVWFTSGSALKLVWDQYGVETVSTVRTPTSTAYATRHPTSNSRPIVARCCMQTDAGYVFKGDPYTAITLLELNGSPPPSWFFSAANVAEASPAAVASTEGFCKAANGNSAQAAASAGAAPPAAAAPGVDASGVAGRPPPSQGGRTQEVFNPPSFKAPTKAASHGIPGLTGAAADTETVINRAREFGGDALENACEMHVNWGWVRRARREGWADSCAPGGSGQLSCWVEAYPQPTPVIPYICRVKQMHMDTSLIAENPGGSDLGGIEAMSSGGLSTYCSDNGQLAEFQQNALQDASLYHVDSMVRSFRIHAGAEAPCDSTVLEPTLFLSREGTTNYYHLLMELYAAYLSLVVNGIADHDFKLLLMDGHDYIPGGQGKGPYHEIVKGMSRHPILYRTSFPGRSNVCFKDAILPMHGRMHKSAWDVWKSVQVMGRRASSRKPGGSERLVRGRRSQDRRTSYLHTCLQTPARKHLTAPRSNPAPSLRTLWPPWALWTHHATTQPRSARAQGCGAPRPTGS